MLRATARSARLPLSWARQAGAGRRARRSASPARSARPATPPTATASRRQPQDRRPVRRVPAQAARATSRRSGGKKPARESAIMTRHGGQPFRRRHEEPRRVLRGSEAQARERADKDLAALGQKIWRGGIAASSVPACAGCHGPAGAGIPAQYPRLAGQFAEYVAAQLKGVQGRRARQRRRTA